MSQERATPTALRQLARFWGTTLLLVASLLVTLITQWGENFEALRWFSFQDFRLLGNDRIVFIPLSESFAQGQWWRLITPIFIHFSLLHLLMNAVLCWELGRRIEFYQGHLLLLCLTLICALISNGAQYLFESALFGGLSGIIYGFFGYCWIYQWVAPNPVYRLPQGLVTLMLLWLVICFTGIFDLLGLVSIANTAHLGGLLVGCLAGLLGGLFRRLFNF